MVSLALDLLCRSRLNGWCYIDDRSRLNDRCRIDGRSRLDGRSHCPLQTDWPASHGRKSVAAKVDGVDFDLILAHAFGQL